MIKTLIDLLHNPSCDLLRSPFGCDQVGRLCVASSCHLGINFSPIFDWIGKLGVRDLLVKKFSISIHNRSRVSRFCSQTVPFWTKSDPEMTQSNNLGYARGLLVTLALFGSMFSVHAVEPIKIGFLYSYTALPNFLERGKNGADMALAEFNQAGGAHGRNVEFIYRDDRGEPADGLQIASDLVDRENVLLLAGMSFGKVSKAVYGYAQRYHIPYFATWCSSDMCVKKDPAYVFSFEEPYKESAKRMAREAATYNIKRWAVVRNMDSWSEAMSTPFIKELKRLSPDVDFVANITQPFGKVKGGAVAQALRGAKAEGVYILLAGSDLSGYLRAQKQRGSLSTYKHIHGYLPPEQLDSLGEEAPTGWFVLGYPERELTTPKHIAFIDAYEEQFNQNPGLSGILSYMATKAMLTAIKQAKSLKREDIIDAARDLTIDTPVGDMTLNNKNFRADFTYWYGYLSMKNGKSVMVNFERNKNVE